MHCVPITNYERFYRNSIKECNEFEELRNSNFTKEPYKVLTLEVLVNLGKKSLAAIFSVIIYSPSKTEFRKNKYSTEYTTSINSLVLEIIQNSFI